MSYPHAILYPKHGIRKVLKRKSGDAIISTKGGIPETSVLVSPQIRAKNKGAFVNKLGERQRFMDGKSLNITEEKLNRLKDIIPEAFTENKIDWEKLKAALGEDIEFKNERYVLNWAGKSDAFRVLQSPSTATLVPCKKESVNFDKTENIFIEGENLEVLKVLQKSYFGKIKMIYIDPPYNTGNDNFIYPDKFAESREEYLSRIGDKDETGFMTREGLFRKNSKDNGHYHSNWLSMMYPRLFMARNLLREDGVIFIHIDDNEVHNLRLLMNEVFGEENFVCQVINRSNPRGSQASKYFAIEHEYILVYCKNNCMFELGGYEKTEEEKSEYNLVDENGNSYRLLGLRQRGGAWKREHRPKMFYPIYINPENGSVSLFKSEIYTVEVTPKRPTGEESRWTWSKELLEKNNQFIVGKKINRSNTEVEVWDIFRKDYLEKENGITLRKPRSIWDEKEVNNQNGRAMVKELFDGVDLFDFPKSTFLPKKIINSLNDDDFIILDFFAGSATTAQAVLDLNKEDAGSRKFICVQLPEKCDENSEAFKAGYKTIAEIGKERIRRVIKKIKEEQESSLNLDGAAGKQDLGFKVFKLRESNFKIWRSKIETEEELVEQLQWHLEPLDENAKTEDVLYELLLKSGVPLTAKIERKNGCILVNDNEIALLLEKVDDKIIKKVIAEKPCKVITLDRLFKKNDQLKTNTALQMKDAGIEFKAV